MGSSLTAIRSPSFGGFVQCLDFSTPRGQRPTFGATELAATILGGLDRYVRLQFGQVNRLPRDCLVSVYGRGNDALNL